MDRFEISTLRSYYGQLLTEKQNEMLRLHYDEDISFGELAEMYGISRQAVLDSIRRGENALEELEKKLKIAEKEDNIFEALNDALRAIGEADTDRAKSCISNIRNYLEG